ncbi:hydroxyethylthiazole kinase [Desulfotalea psychrophila]|uniref:Hydroxyethylthiazole kinase n=1 Tax=Desulfotalea psychrophila (strain LSv54 / DSM 12343) TaxID=177439 RepID=THIM_DESPS|nr:hydroxyethylthiazole kinase [Desulfotalea psychrophila]Q6AQZ6.2 RecName: Full=Hydroxyethylthiazole kinase; AltName: Full=4-methyl-5-beta-hydroxyethylthiazole kinase; Short=TH kinase; Short=Thz kinase [Desulfotalea psychrophila LSv54]
MSNISLTAAENLQQIRENKPLIHNITNFVVMNYTANVLLATGASPVMAHAQNEVEEMVAFAGSLVLNIGTLSESWVSSMLMASQRANTLKTPIILDPVGSGATAFRTASAKRIIAEAKVSVIRGNASEILSLGSEQSNTRGVDTSQSVSDAAQTASLLARELDTILAITGPTDLVTDGRRVFNVDNGHPLMPYVTGTGCSATAVVGAFAAVDRDYLRAATTALAFFGLAGEMAGKAATGPGSFMIHLLDALYNMSPEQLEKGCRIKESSATRS